MEVCTVCGVEKHGLVFQTERDRINKTTSTPDFVQTRICRHAKKKGCINVTGKVNTALDYKDFGITAEQWLDTAREMATSTATAKQSPHAVLDDRLAS